MEAPDFDELEWMAQQEGLFLQHQEEEEEYMVEQAWKEEEINCPEEFEESNRPSHPTGSVALTLFILHPSSSICVLPVLLQILKFIGNISNIFILCRGTFRW